MGDLDQFAVGIWQLANPSSGLLTIEIRDGNIKMINVFNQLGECIYSSSALNCKKKIINCRELKDGI